MAEMIDGENIALLVELEKIDGTLVPATIRHGRERVLVDNVATVRDCIRWSANGSDEKGPGATLKVTARTAASLASLRITRLAEDEDGSPVEEVLSFPILRRDETWTRTGPPMGASRTLWTGTGVGTGHRLVLTGRPNVQPHGADPEGPWKLAFGLELTDRDGDPSGGGAVLDF